MQHSRCRPGRHLSQRLRCCNHLRHFGVMGGMLRLRSLAGAAGGAEGYWSRVFDADGERMGRACLAQIDAFATTPPIEEWDEEAGEVVVVSEDPYRGPE